MMGKEGGEDMGKEKMTEKQRDALEYLLHDPGVRYCEQRQTTYYRRYRAKNRQE